MTISISNQWIYIDHIYAHASGEAVPESGAYYTSPTGSEVRPSAVSAHRTRLTMAGSAKL